MLWRHGKAHAAVCVWVRTGAGHLEGVRVRAIVSIPADAVHGALTGGTAVDGALHARLVSLSWLEKAGRAG